MLEDEDQDVRLEAAAALVKMGKRDGADPAPLAKLQLALRTWRPVVVRRQRAAQHPDARTRSTPSRPPSRGPNARWRGSP